jgi:hypothetical protein
MKLHESVEKISSHQIKKAIQDQLSRGEKKDLQPVQPVKLIKESELIESEQQRKETVQDILDEISVQNLHPIVYDCLIFVSKKKARTCML